MSLIGGMVVFSITWIIVLFTVLPWGVRTAEESNETVEPGTVESAPVNPRIWTKFAATTVITALLFVIFWATAEFEIIDYRALMQ